MLFDGKYLFEANLRADGTSRFAKGNRWGYFPSFSAGWNFSREKIYGVRYFGIELGQSCVLPGVSWEIKTFPVITTPTCHLS